jgi:phosphate transport system protein
LRQFSVELEELHEKVLQMGGHVESAIHRSVRALVDRDPELARQVEIEIDNLTTRLFALRQPMARDLRFLTATMKINTDLERMGDLAVNIAQRALSLTAQSPVKPLIDIPRMAQLVESMLLRTLDAFVKSDAEEATSVLTADDEVDALRDSVYQELVTYMQSDPSTVPAAVDLMFVARNLERIADHATNIAEDVVFLVKGVDVRHHAVEVAPEIRGA